MKKYITLLLLTFIFFTTLSSCSSICTIGAAAFITTAWNDPRTLGSQLDDNILKIHIYHALYHNKQIKNNTRIINTIYKGNVLLTGQAPSAFLSQEVIKIVSNIHGVKNIYNAIRLDQPISYYNILLDLFISNQIRINLFIHKNMHISKIKVISENREIFLLGEVTTEEGKNAEKIAKNVKGVKQVFTAFIYTQPPKAVNTFLTK